MEAIVDTLTTLYHTVGFNALLAALDTVLVRQWDEYQHTTGEHNSDLEREIAQLKKARLPLTDKERAEVRTHGIMWYPSAEGPDDA